LALLANVVIPVLLVPLGLLALLGSKAKQGPELLGSRARLVRRELLVALAHQEAKA
jgi:hypothetical protein